MLTAGMAGLETLELLPIGVLTGRPRDLVPLPLGVAIAGHRNAAADDVSVAADELIVVAGRRRRRRRIGYGGVRQDRSREAEQA